MNPTVWKLLFPVPTFWELAVPLILAFGLFLASRECSLIKKSREAEVLMHVTQIWDSGEYINARRIVDENKHNLAQKMKEYEEKNDEKYFIIAKVANFFENVGLLVDKKYLPGNVVMQLIEPSAKHYYGLYKEDIEQSRQEKKLPDIYKYFERLAKIELNQNC